MPSSLEHIWHLYCCCCIRNSSSGFAFMKLNTRYEIVSWTSRWWNLLSLLRTTLTFNWTATKIRKVSFLSAAAAAITFCFPGTAVFYDYKNVRGGLCVWKQNCSISEQAAVTSLFLSSPLQSVTNDKKKDIKKKVFLLLRFIFDVA